MTLEVYSFDYITGEFCGITVADESPLEPGTFLDPAYTTRIAPPSLEAGFAPVFDGSVWAQVRDHRGETWWDDTGQAIVISGLGDPADFGLVITEPVEPETEPGPYRRYKSVFIRRLTEAEAVTMEAVLEAAEAKLRLMFNSVEYFDSDDELFGTLMGAVGTALGEDRAAELLASE